MLLITLPLVAACCLCAPLYLVFHDDLLASLIKRQSDIQYAYEDRIAALKAELDSAQSEIGVRDVPSEAVKELTDQGTKLEARAAMLERLASELAAGTRDAPLAPALRRQAAEAPDALSPRLGPYAERRLDAVAKGLRRVEAAEAEAARKLREPMLRRLARMHTALTETGLAPSRWRQPGATEALGGPFVPLTSATSLDASIALLREASAEQDRLGRIVDAVPLRQPLDGALTVTSPFGPRIDPFLGRAALHTGVDLREDTGDAVMATAAGTVTIAGPDGGYGNLVEIDHGAGLVTRYGHLSAVEVTAGQRLVPGTIVGRVGATGRATGPHLHYETRIDGQPVDPERFLKAATLLEK